MAAKLTRPNHKIVIQLRLVAESYTTSSFHSRWPVRKLLDTLSYFADWWNTRCTIIQISTKQRTLSLLLESGWVLLSIIMFTLTPWSRTLL